MAEIRPLNLIIFVFVLKCVSVEVECKNILVMCPLASKSHKNVLEPIATALAERGHQVTLISSHGTQNKNRLHKNVTEIQVGDFGIFWKQIGNPFEFRAGGKLNHFTLTMDPVFDICHEFYNRDDLMKLMEVKTDLVIMEGFLHECLLGFVHKLSINSNYTPFVLSSPLPGPSFITQLTGNRLPPSFVPALIMDFSHKMNFIQRFFNLIFTLLLEVWMDFMIAPKSTEIYRQYLGQDLPDVAELYGNVAMILSNSHFVTNFPKPTLPDVVEVGGIHCRPANPLPQDLKRFCDESGENGFIVFSLGSIAQGHMMPENMRKMFLNVFSRLKVRVVWKWESGHMDNLPPNVRLERWLPQQDILGHPKIKLFMTHGGLLSTQESIYHGVPIIGIPIFADQDMNVNKAVKMGYALNIEIVDATEEIVESTINQMLNDSQFSDRVKTYSKLWQDQETTPLSRAIFWMEYLMRNRGGHFLRSAARDLNFFQYHSIDVIAAIFVILLVLAWMSKCFILFVFKKVCQILVSLTGEHKKPSLKKLE